MKHRGSKRVARAKAMNRCDRKRSYATKADAAPELRRLKGRGRRTADRLQVYRCPRCGLFHIGSWRPQ